MCETKKKKINNVGLSWGFCAGGGGGDRWKVKSSEFEDFDVQKSSKGKGSEKGLDSSRTLGKQQRTHNETTMARIKGSTHVSQWGKLEKGKGLHTRNRKKVVTVVDGFCTSNGSVSKKGEGETWGGLVWFLNRTNENHQNVQSGK